MFLLLDLRIGMVILFLDLGSHWNKSDNYTALFPGKLLWYNCSPSFNWNGHPISRFVQPLKKTLAIIMVNFFKLTIVFGAVPGQAAFVQLLPILQLEEETDGR
jgi:hypothetical protein